MRLKYLKAFLIVILLFPPNTIWADEIDSIVEIFETKLNIADHFSLTGPIENDHEAKVPGRLNFITTTASDYSVDQVKALRNNLSLTWFKIPPNIRIRLEIQKKTLSNDSNNADVDVLYRFIARESNNSTFAAMPPSPITIKMRNVNDSWLISNIPEIIDHIAGTIQAVPKFMNYFHKQVTIILNGNPFVHDFNERRIFFHWAEDVSAIKIQVTAVASNPSIASVELSNDRLTVKPLAVGESTITLKAKSSLGHEISQSFEAVVRLDLTAPSVTSPFATNNTTDIDPVIINREGFFFTFNEEINTEKIQTSIQTDDQTLTWLPIWSDGNTKLTLKPADHQELDFKTEYQIILSHIQDKFGNVADELAVTFFTTALGEGPLGPIALDLNAKLGDQKQRQSTFLPEIGDQVIVDVVSISGAQNNMGFQIKFQYDVTQLEWVGFQTQDIFFAGTVIPPIPSDGIVEVSVATLDNKASKDTGSLGHAIFKVLDNFTGETRVELISASYDQPVEVGSGGSVVIIGGVLVKTPDFNGDGTVGFSDFIAFAHNFGKTQEDPDFNTRYDLDNSGAVDFADFIRFEQAFSK